MAVKIRLSRIGSKNNPHYRIVVKEARSNRDGKSLEILGHYDPFTKEVKANLERINYWVSMGAQKTKTLDRLINPRKGKPEVKKSAPKEKTGKGAKSKRKTGAPAPQKEQSE